jgi:NADH-quinone oxidoreductase subunit D
MQVTNKLTPFFENLNFERDDNSMVINFGPQHPSAHGQLRLVLELEGELVKKAYPDIGYLHRGVEKMAENMTYNEFLPTTDRLDYIASTSNNYAYALSVERLLGVEVPRRAMVIRTMLLELNRIISHLFFIATHALDIGAMSVFLYAFREREFAMDLMEDYCGARLTHSSVRIGGVPLDIPSDWMENVSAFCDKLDKEIEITYEALLTENRIWKMRLEDVGVVPPEEALSWGCTGPMLRGSGIPYDIRKEEPYELYPELDFDIPVSDTNDSYGRYRIYIEEMKQSTRILRQLIPMYDDTEPQLMAHAPRYISAPKEEIMTQNYALMQHFVLVTQGMRPPKGEVYVATESPKGELGFYIKSEGEPYAYRLKIRAPSFYHTGYLQKMLLGAYIPDVVTMISTTNIVFGEVDR